MDMAIEFPIDHTAPWSAPSELYQRSEASEKSDARSDYYRENEGGWDFFPGLLPA